MIIKNTAHLLLTSKLNEIVNLFVTSWNSRIILRYWSKARSLNKVFYLVLFLWKYGKNIFESYNCAFGFLRFGSAQVSVALGSDPRHTWNRGDGEVKNFHVALGSGNKVRERTLACNIQMQLNTTPSSNILDYFNFVSQFVRIGASSWTFIFGVEVRYLQYLHSHLKLFWRKNGFKLRNYAWPTFPSFLSSIAFISYQYSFKLCVALPAWVFVCIL